MEPPTCTVVVRLVRTTLAVATGLLPPDEELMLLLLLSLLEASATPLATAAPTRTPARAATATTRLAENSATDDHTRLGTRPSIAARPALRP